MKPMKPRQPGGPHDALSRLMSQIALNQGKDPEAGVQIAADFEGVSPWTLYKQLDPDQGSDVPFSRVARLTSKFEATAIPEFFAHLVGGIFIALPKAGAGEPRWCELTAEVAEDMGRTMSEIMRALAPTSPGASEITPAEAAKCLALALELASHLSTLIGELRERTNPEETRS